jgi:hypothetical protein
MEEYDAEFKKAQLEEANHILVPDYDFFKLRERGFKKVSHVKIFVGNVGYYIMRRAKRCLKNK